MDNSVNDDIYYIIDNFFILGDMMDINYLCDKCLHNNGYFQHDIWPYKKTECIASGKIRYFLPREKTCKYYVEEVDNE